MANNPITEQDFKPGFDKKGIAMSVFAIKKKVQSAKKDIMNEIMATDGDDYYISKKDAHDIIRKWLDIPDRDDG